MATDILWVLSSLLVESWDTKVLQNCKAIHVKLLIMDHALQIKDIIDLFMKLSLMSLDISKPENVITRETIIKNFNWKLNISLILYYFPEILIHILRKFI